MKTLKLLLLLALPSSSVNTLFATNELHWQLKYTDFPAKTVFIKSPNASDAAAFFSTNKALMFEVYKTGSKEDLEKIVKAFRSDPAVESFNSGILNGDYQVFVLTLKNLKDKAWFISAFKRAGLNHIKLSQNAVIAVETM